MANQKRVTVTSLSMIDVGMMVATQSGTNLQRVGTLLVGVYIINIVD